MKANPLAAAVALAVGSMGVTTIASAVTFNFANNTRNYLTAETGTLFGFNAGNEFHVVTSGGAKLNDGNKDVISGNETWTFTSNILTAVSGTGNNSGGGGEAAGMTTNFTPTFGTAIASHVTGFPVATTANTVASIQDGASFLQTTNIFTMGAPVQGGTLANIFGAGTLTDISTANFTQAGTFTINMPVLLTQWATGSYIIGGDPDPGVNGDQCSANGPCGGPGVTWNGTTDGSGNFTLFGSYRMTADEVTVSGFADNYTEWALTGTYSNPAAVPVPAAAWLLGSGLLGMVGVARRRRKL